MRSSTSQLLVIPRHNLTFGSRSFCISAPKIWNSLTPQIRQCQTLANFRRHLYGSTQGTPQFWTSDAILKQKRSFETETRFWNSKRHSESETAFWNTNALPEHGAKNRMEIAWRHCVEAGCRGISQPSRPKTFRIGLVQCRTADVL